MIFRGISVAFETSCLKLLSITRNGNTILSAHPAAAPDMSHMTSSNATISLTSSAGHEVGTAAQHGTSSTDGVHGRPHALHVHALHVVQLFVQLRNLLFQADFAMLKVCYLKQVESHCCQTQSDDTKHSETLCKGAVQSMSSRAAKYLVVFSQ